MIPSRKSVRTVVGLLGVLLLAIVTPVRAAESPEDERARAVTSSASFKAAVAAYERDFDRFVAELIQLTEIPAPPFGEKARG